MGYYPQVCFLCQQAAEKALKAILFSQKQKLIRTHNLERLLEKALVFHKDFLSLERSCRVLNSYYTDTRYPDVWDYSRFDDKKLAKEAIDLAGKVIGFVREKLADEG